MTMEKHLRLGRLCVLSSIDPKFSRIAQRRLSTGVATGPVTLGGEPSESREAIGTCSALGQPFEA